LLFICIYQGREERRGVSKKKKIYKKRRKEKGKERER
jgi:hypothetical protein